MYRFAYAILCAALLLVPGVGQDSDPVPTRGQDRNPVLRLAPSPRLAAGDLKREPGYMLLFNGKNLDGWREAGGKKAALDGKTEAFGGRFKIVDGMLIYDPSVKGDRYIETVKEFGKDVSIKFDFRPGPKCNNDVFLRGIKFDIVPGNKECKTVKQGEWSTLEIVVSGNKVEHKINGMTVRTSKAKAAATPLKLRAEFGAIEVKNIRAKE